MRAGAPAVRAGLRADPGRSFGAARQRFAAAQGAARARPARRTGLRDAPWLGASHVPRTRADALHGPVADPLTDHPARTIAARWRDHPARDRRRSEHTVRAYLATAHRLVEIGRAHV